MKDLLSELNQSVRQVLCCCPVNDAESGQDNNKSQSQPDHPVGVTRIENLQNFPANVEDIDSSEGNLQHLAKSMFILFLKEIFHGNEYQTCWFACHLTLGIIFSTARYSMRHIISPKLQKLEPREKTKTKSKGYKRITTRWPPYQINAMVCQQLLLLLFLWE